MYQHYVNHISLIVDKSSSMSSQRGEVVRVFDKELEYLKQRSIDLDQETRISIYLFADTPEILTFDMDVMRFKSLAGHYTPYGNTALIDAVLRSVEDNKQLPQIHGDHAFLQYVITDGQENRSKATSNDLRAVLNRLPENWTTACLVPDSRSKFEAKKFGFDEDAIAVWDTTKVNAIESVGRQFSSTLDNYMTMRSHGVRGTRSLFALDTSGLVKSKLDEVSPWSYQVYRVDYEAPIKEYVERISKKPYRLGAAFYQPVKKVTIQDYKDILVQDVKTQKVYEGDNLRKLLGLPDGTVDVDPGDHRDWRIFVQSTSTNRKLFADTYLLVKN